MLEATVFPNRSAYIAYTVFAPFWRQGYAREGCARMLRHLLEDYRVLVVVAEMDTRNAASVSLAEALGFVQVGTTVGADHFKGSVSDEYRYELHVEGNPDPVRIRDLHTLYFGEARPKDVVAVDGDVRGQVAEVLRLSGYVQEQDIEDEDLSDALSAYIRIENFEEQSRSVVISTCVSST